MDKTIRRLFLFFVLLFLALVVQLTYVQVWAADDLNTHPANTRAIQAEMMVKRGVILSADGVKLADNKEQGPYYFREYHQGELVSPWLGYNSLRYGRAGVERVYNQELSGQTGVLGLAGYWDKILGRTHQGADLQLTVDMRVQRAAAEALGTRKGAVVALDPRTGATLALVSYPRYDPNRLEEMWADLNSDEDRPLFNRPTQGLYPPGSVFKIVVTAAALEDGVITPGTEFEDTGSVTAGGFVVDNYDGRVYGKHNFADAFASSINTTFAKVGVQVGAESLEAYASAFGFGRENPWPLGGATSFFPPATDLDKAHVAQVSYGQGEVLTTPLEMALVAAAVANGGKIMEPYLVSKVVSAQGTVLEEASPAVWARPISAATAETLRALMVEVVKRGTGTRAGVDNVQVAGKTGTAEVTSGEPHAWFVGFAPAVQPRVVVAVLVENGGAGGSVAAPIAREVIAAALGL